MVNSSQGSAGNGQPRRVRVERGIYRNPATGTLEIVYSEPGGRQRWQTISGDLPEARRLRQQSRNSQQGMGETRGGRSFADLAEEWLALQTHLRPRTRELYRTALDRHLNPRIGQLPLTEVDEDVIADLIVDLSRQGLSGWTVRGILVPFGRVLTYAIRRKLIRDNPMRRLERNERPTVTRREMRILTPEEIDALLAAATPSYRPILATAIFTGLRQGELLGLRWADIDRDNGLVHVRRQFDRNGVYSQPKTPRALRSVLLFPSLATLLEQHRAASAHDAPLDPVFATLTGRPMHYRNVSRRGLAVAVARAGLDRAGEPRLRFHDLRHCFTALLIAQGLSVVFISRMLGHSSASFTLDIYGGLFDRAEHMRRASDALEHEFGASLSPYATPHTCAS